MLSSFLYVPANVIVQTPGWKLNFEVTCFAFESVEKHTSLLHYVIERNSRKAKLQPLTNFPSFSVVVKAFRRISRLNSLGNVSLKSREVS